jgi:hypothetical protein
LLVRFPVEVEPVVGSLPLQPPEAVQEVALVATQVNIALEPFATVLGFAASVTVGTGWITETVADCDALPPVPVQVSVYLWLLVRFPVDDEPLTGWLPAQAPEAVQVDALVEDQVKVELAPLRIVLGLADSVTVGIGWVTATVADCAVRPPGPVQVIVKVVLVLSAPVD